MFNTLQTQSSHTRGSVSPQRFSSLFLLLAKSDLQLLTLPLTERQVLPESKKVNDDEERVSEEKTGAVDTNLREMT